MQTVTNMLAQVGAHRLGVAKERPKDAGLLGEGG
jgi:hypothetical protein